MDLAQSTRNKLSNGEGSSKSTAQQHQVMIDSSDSESSDVEEIPPLQVILGVLFGIVHKNHANSIQFYGVKLLKGAAFK